MAIARQLQRNPLHRTRRRGSSVAGAPGRLAATLLLLTLAWALDASAQTVLRRDGSAGAAPAGDVPGAPRAGGGLEFEVGEGLGERRGGNLIHSFDRLDIGRGDLVRFTGAPAIDTVISRVTGGSKSHVDGTLRSEIPGAAFYLINPRGVVLGPDASIDVDGSVHLSTAQRLRFADGTLLSTDSATAVPALVAAPPSAFGFLDGPVAPVKIDRSELALAPGSTFQVAAGRIRILRREDPTVRVVGGELVIEHRPTFDLPGGELLLAAVESEGELPVDGLPDLSAFERWGRIHLRGSRPLPDDADPDEADDGGFEPVLSADLGGDAGGRAVLRGRVLEARDWFVSADGGDAPGPARAIDVAMSEGIRLKGTSTFSSIARGAAAGGEVRFEAPRIELRDDAEILSDTTDFGGTGSAGLVRIAAGRLVLDGDAEIASDADEGSRASAGQVEIRADSVMMRGDSEISSDTGGSGSGGGVVLRVEDDLRIEERAGVFTNAKVEPGETGDAGDIDIRAGRVTVRGGHLSAAASGASDGGNVVLAGDDVALDRATLSASVRGGAGGNVRVEADNLAALDSRVVANAEDGRGGRIDIVAKVLLSGGSVFDASAGDPALSGIVRIDALQVDVTDDLETLASEVVDASSLLGPRCAQRSGSDPRSSFVAHSDPPLLPAPDSVEGLVDPPGPVSASRANRTAAPRSARLTEALRRALEADEAARAGELARIEALASSIDDRSLRARAELVRARVLGRTDADLDAHQLLAVHAALDAAGSQARAAADLRMQSYALGRMAELYRREGRLEEALWLVRRAGRLAAEARDPGARFRWSAEEGRILWALGRTLRSIEARRRAVALLDGARRSAVASGGAGAEFEQAMAPVYLELVDALLLASERASSDSVREALWREARSTVERFKAAELRDYFQDECVADLAARRTDLDRVSGSAAIVYPIAFPDRLELLVTWPSGLRRYVVDVRSETLEREARRLRVALQRVTSKRFEEPARRLHQWLVAPYAAELAESAVDTLVFVPDGALRTVPMAALHDGDHFLVEEIALAVTPGLSLTDPHPLELDTLQLLAGGLSEPVEGFSALPNVPQELAAIRELLGGEVLQDARFEVERLRSRFEADQPSVVHLATHAEFGGDSADSFLLTHDGRLTMDDLAEVVGSGRFRERPLELLVLSACQTAIGDDRSALGLAGVAVRAGARSAVGSLWSIADEATYELVTEFYRQLAQGAPSRAEALRRAQRSLIDGDRFAHPFFWSPFLLVSNWL
ncbi:MAG: CHAT domain-containing protein [Myxococcota bacterium]